MQKVTIFLLASVMAFTNLSFLPARKEKINWITVAALQEAYAKQPRPILIDVYTGWCGWCKVMDKETYTNEKVAAYINEKYYAVKFDAEQRDSVEWAGKKYGYNPNNKVHDLAVLWLYGQMSYPTTVFMPKMNAQPAPLPGYMKPADLEPPLKYFGDGAYKNNTFVEFNKGFKASW